MSEKDYLLIRKGLKKNPPKTILFLNQTSQISGAEKVLIQLAHELQSRGHYIVIGAPGSGPLAELARANGFFYAEISIPFITRHVNPFNLTSNLIKCLKTGKQLQTLIQKKEIDIIHANHFRALISLSLTKLGVPIVWQVHDVFQNKFPNNWLIPLVMKKVKQAVCVSNFVRNNLISLGISPVKCSVLHNAIRIQYAECTLHNQNFRQKLLKELELKDKKVMIVGLVGSISAWKGHHILIEAAPLILKFYPNTHFVFVGDVINPKGIAYKEKITNMIRAKKLVNRFHFLGFRHDVISLMSAFDVLVHTSISPDPFPTVLLEALAVGAIIIATKSGGVPEIIEDGVSGILVESNNPMKLAKAVIDLLKADTSLRHRMRKKARLRSIRFQNEERWINAWEKHYNDCF